MIHINNIGTKNFELLWVLKQNHGLETMEEDFEC
jgi:hypothetical protein